MLITLAALILLVGGGVLYVSLNGTSDSETPSASTQTEDRNTPTVQSRQSGGVEESFAGTGSFADLMELGRDIECDFSYVADDTNAAVAGTVKVAGEKIRGDFAMEQGGQAYNSSLIQDGVMIYTWSETPQGTFALQMPVTDVEEEEESLATDRGMDMDADVTYECRSWTVDARAFVPPSDIDFMSPDMMMQNLLQEYGVPGQ